MRPLGVVALLATGCLSAPSSGGDAGGGDDGDGGGGECVVPEAPGIATELPGWVGNVLDLEFDDASDQVFHDHSGQRRDAPIRAMPRTDSVDADHGRALVLAGNDSVDMPDSDAFDLQSFTIEMWINRSDQGAEAALLSDFVEGTGTWEVGLTALGQLRFRNSGGMATVEENLLTVWQHIAVTRDDGGEVCLYVGGIQASCGEMEMPVAPGGTRNWTIGRRADGTNAFAGSMDALRISDHAKTGAQVAASMNAGGADAVCGDLVVEQEEDCEPNALCCNEVCEADEGCGEAECEAVVPTRGLLALYAFDEGDGTVAHDSASSGGDPLDLDLTGAAALTDEGLQLAGGRALPAGDPSRLIDAILDSGAFTIDAWVTTESADADAAFVPIMSLSADATAAAVLGVTTGTAPTYSARISSALTSDGQPNVEAPPPDESLNERRTHVVVTRTTAGVRSLYIDGRLRSFNQVGGDLAWAAGTVHLGVPAPSTEETWPGVIHRLAIHSVALDSAEVANSFFAHRAE